MKKSINYLNIVTVIAFIFMLNFVKNFIKSFFIRAVPQQPPIQEPEPEKTIGFKPNDPQDKFFIVEDEQEHEQEN